MGCGGAPLTNGTSCTGIAQDWIAVETGGGYDAGDPFDQWWGDDTWRTAVASYELVQGKGSYIQYEAKKLLAPPVMNVSVHNLVGKTIQIRAVDPTTGKYGVTLCGRAPLTNGTSCTGIAQDWIAVETGGGYDAGDPFDQWWGDDTWRTAVASYELVQGKGSYIQYEAKKVY